MGEAPLPGAREPALSDAEGVSLRYKSIPIPLRKDVRQKVEKGFSAPR